jgi:hypothetical protein
MNHSCTRRKALKLGGTALVVGMNRFSWASSAVAPRISPALSRLHEMLSTRMVALVKAAQFNQAGITFTRPCVDPTYAGVWPDDCIWPFIAEPKLAQQTDWKALMAWLTEAVVDLPTVPDRVQFDGLAVMSPGGIGHAPLSQRMPLHLPSAWTRYLQYVESFGVVIPRKHDWAEVIRRSFDQVPFSFGLVYSDPQNEVVGFGFHDTIRLTGEELMSSLITLRGLQRASELFEGFLDPSILKKWSLQATVIRVHLDRLYSEEVGGFVGASSSGHQFSVWGNGLAYSFASTRQKQSILKFYRENKDRIFLRGCTRQVAEPGGWNGTGRNFVYQTGGYWATGTGFVLPALADGDPTLADELCNDLAADLASFDSAEWLDERGDPHGARSFLASVSLPLLATRSIMEGKSLLSYL